MHSTNKKFSIKNFKKIYLMVPANVSTGGPEALHQLGNILKNDLKKDIQIFYIPNDHNNPVHPNYKKYNLEFTNEIYDDPENLLIIPEYFNYLIEALKFNKISKAIWWLSIDNYIGSRFRFTNNKFLRSFYKIPFNLVEIFNRLTNFFFGILTIEDYLKFIYKLKNINTHDEIRQASYHFTQSDYAYNFLKKKFSYVENLSDFIREDLLNNLKFSINQKENIICYNPKKSNKFMDYLMKNTNFKFVPLINLTNEEIINILKKSKIYIDIGSHPGKDRLPREAALLGNCIITNKKGSAGNPKDLSIPSEFKFKENLTNLNKINNKINQIFDDYDNEFDKFKEYLNSILKEENNFKNEVRNIFGK